MNERTFVSDAERRRYEWSMKQKNICGVHDFITNETCVREKNHAPFHELADGTKFGIAVEDGM